MPGLQALEQARLAGEAVELAREVGGVAAVEEQAVDLVAHGLAQAAQARGDAAGTRPARHSAAISGAQSHHIEGMTATSTPASSSGSSAGPKAPHSSTTPRRVGGAQLARRSVSSTSPWMRTRSSAAGALGGLDQQLRALVRVGRAEEGDGQRARRRGRARGRGRGAPRPRRRRAWPGWTTSIISAG